MKITWTIFGICGYALAGAQNVTSVYNRDTHEAFRLKTVHVDSTVVGPLVKTSTVLTYANPYKTNTEATLNFVLPDFAALGGFAYFYGHQYVRGQLMDKSKAWFIYTAITRRGRDPGIMEQWSPTDYHCQIFPIKQDSDLRIRLWTIGMLKPEVGSWLIPEPSVPRAVGYQATDPTLVKPELTVRMVHTGRLVLKGQRFAVEITKPAMAVAQKFKDGRIYVAGFVHARPKQSAEPIEIDGAFYEPLGRFKGGLDVTKRVSQLVENGQISIDANNSTFGDPNPNIVKQLRINYKLDNKNIQRIVPENHRILLLDDAYDATGEKDGLKIPDLNEVERTHLEVGTVAFAGWLRKNQSLTLTFHGRKYQVHPELIASGNDVARLWAQQVLSNRPFNRQDEMLAFSMKYGVPSKATALLAVPSQEMHLFREKEKAFAEKEANERRESLELQRQKRNWEGHRNQNWNSSGGGDPEIRIQAPDAVKVDAVLPDQRVLALNRMGAFWGGNFEIDANAPEGQYLVKILAHQSDGTIRIISWTYEVKRHVLVGTAKAFVKRDGVALEVRAEAGLYEVSAYAADARHWSLHEDQPGIYRGHLPLMTVRKWVVLLKDRAGNKGVLTCSLPPQ